MHKNFAEWYRLVRTEPNGDLLKTRWAGVEEWGASLHGKDDAVLETVRIFQGLPEVTSREPFLAVFRKHDAAFQQRNNELEQQLLAGATLAQVITRGEEAGDDASAADPRTAILAGTALAASRLRVADGTLEEIRGEMLAGLQELARHERRRKGIDTTLLTDAEEKSFSKAIESNAADLNQLRQNLTTAFQAILKSVRRAERSLANAANDLRCADEETNILWWLQGECSRDLNRPWSALKDEVPITAGWELADLTDIALGPREAAAFLERVVSFAKGKSEHQPLHSYVNAVSDDWAKMRTSALPARALDLAPLSLALLQRAKGGTSNWQEYFEKTGGVAPTKPLSPEVAAKQTYLEAVMLRTLAETED